MSELTSLDDLSVDEYKLFRRISDDLRYLDSQSRRNICAALTCEFYRTFAPVWPGFLPEVSDTRR